MNSSGALTQIRGSADDRGQGQWRSYRSLGAQGRSRLPKTTHSYWQSTPEAATFRFSACAGPCFHIGTKCHAVEASPSP